MQNELPKVQDEPDIKTHYQKRYQTNKCLEKYSYMLIRPPRLFYNEALLDPRRKYPGVFQHTVFYVPFPLSLYAPHSFDYVVLYLHGNSSSRCQGFYQLCFLPPGVALACFDFSGCGNRKEGEYISLGKNESKEVDIAVRFLREIGLKVVVWGRSMGAVSALLSEEAEVVIADSAFSSLYDTTKALSKTQVCAPLYCIFECIYPCFFWLVGRDVKEKCGVHPSDMEIKDFLAKSNPNRYVLLLAATQDQMIHYSHSQILYDSFPGSSKKLIFFKGTHNSDRPQEVIDEIFTFASTAISQVTSKKNDKIESKTVEADTLQMIRKQSGDVVKGGQALSGCSKELLEVEDWLQSKKTSVQLREKS